MIISANCFFSLLLCNFICHMFYEKCYCSCIDEFLSPVVL